MWRNGREMTGDEGEVMLTWTLLSASNRFLLIAGGKYMTKRG